MRTGVFAPFRGQIEADNLRRSLSAPMAVAALLAGWFLPFDAALTWTLLVSAIVMAPAIIPILSGLTVTRPGIPFLVHLRSLATDFSFALIRSFFVVVFLADQAWLMGDAIVRTIYRLTVSRRNLLEWVSHAQTAVSPHAGIPGFAKRMAGALILGLASLCIAFWQEDGNWLLAAPFAVVWLCSPAIALWASLPPTKAGRPFVALWAAFPGIARWASLSPVLAGQLPIRDEDADALRLTARRTWRFFEVFVTAEDNMLPPDNFQEAPAPALAHRTSPTNIGLYLLSVVSARDFGWIGTSEALERIEATLKTMQTMQHVRGHLYNWHDTRTLLPLEPYYISSVDSGNLAGHLIALARSCDDWAGTPITQNQCIAGIADALNLANLEVARLQKAGHLETADADQASGTLVDGIAALKELIPRSQPLHEPLTVLREQAEALNRKLSGAPGTDYADLLFWTDAAVRAVQSHITDSQIASVTGPSIPERLIAVAETARNMALAMEFGFLFDTRRKLLSIGYLVHEEALDPNCYDLIASEARLASFFAIAKGDIPAQHWFRLGRSVVLVARQAALISWSGSMFEYLMPSLVMRAPLGSLIEQTSRLIVRRQIDYASSLGVPWGISESAYNVRDLEFTYQYSNFGIPGLGLKRGLDANIVVAPYATALAAMVDPRAAVGNLDRIASIGGLGQFGFYEALDFTPVRVPLGETVSIVKAYMAHHQGMTIVAIANALLNAGMRARFHADPLVQATELLLQERPPRDVVAPKKWEGDAKSVAKIRNSGIPGGRSLIRAHEKPLATHLLSNGQYSVMLTSGGSGYSRWQGTSVTRWREDATCDDWGSYIFLRDLADGRVWSTGYQPSGAEPDEYDVIFNEDRAIFTRRDGTMSTMMEVLVSGEDNAEVRHVSLSNNGDQAREFDITSYAELALATQASDQAHPVFSKLFVQTEYLVDVEAIIATRRQRTAMEEPIWAAHLAIVDGETLGSVEIESSRARFLGRNGTTRKPQTIAQSGQLTGTTGMVLDPVFALRHKVRVPAGGMVRIAFWTMVASSREALLDCIDKHRDSAAFARAATLAWTQAQVQQHHIGIEPSHAALFQRLATPLLYAGQSLRSTSETIARGAGGQPGLWSLSISGDLPIILLRISDEDHLDLARQLMLAHEYWRMKHFNVDLIVLNERGSSYVQDLQIAIEELMRASQSRSPSKAGNLSGKIFVVRADLMAPETRALLLSVARVVLVGQRGGLADQLARAHVIRRSAISQPPFPAAPFVRWKHGPAPVLPELEFFNGTGGFGDKGREYVVVLAPGVSTPAPWINVIANPTFGFQVAAEGSGYTWSLNSRENQLTPWSNDPTSDRSGEVFYLKNEECGEVWTATAEPMRDPTATYIARHGRGFSRFTTTSREIAVDLLQFVPVSDPIKISRLSLCNLSDRPRKLSITAYAEWVLGPSRSTSAPYVTTALDEETGALFVRNAWTPGFASCVAFFDMAGNQTDWTADRTEFLGRNGSLANPQALRGHEPLSGAAGAGFDPCGALRQFISLPPGGTAEIVVFLGQSGSSEEAQALIRRYRGADLDAAFSDVRTQWAQVLEGVQVKTPDRSMDIMLNGWLLYQTLACRVWARSAFYQASGAYGFRDQLQDGMALVTVRPDLTRAHLLRAAARQFIEGDVQHWWWPNTGQGVRTRISDDRAWLAYAALRYIEVSGDARVMDEMIPFLEGQWLREGEHDSLFQPMVSDSSASLFEHCALGLDKSLALGVHGLPLMGSGDWNDGMNRVGEDGRGESVWLAWLHCATLVAFAPVAEARGERDRAANWRSHAETLRASIEREAWDGDWYRRGYYDDGAPLGSASSDECRIDSIAQSWAVISRAADPERARRAMAAVDRELILPNEQLALLFKPPFDKTAHDPGYIKGYPPGVRENGGQYSHAAMWSIMAFAMLGEGDKAARLFALVNPINHARTRGDMNRYVVEPYVIAADVYAVAPHTGRGGWTWYTGSAGWMQRAGMESILGVRVKAGVLHLAPCIPESWPEFSISLTIGTSRYDIHAGNPDKVSQGITRATLDGKDIAARPLAIPLVDDGKAHEVRITLG